MFGNPDVACSFYHGSFSIFTIPSEIEMKPVVLTAVEFKSQCMLKNPDVACSFYRGSFSIFTIPSNLIRPNTKVLSNNIFQCTE